MLSSFTHNERRIKIASRSNQKSINSVEIQWWYRVNAFHYQEVQMKIHHVSFNIPNLARTVHGTNAEKRF